MSSNFVPAIQYRLSDKKFSQRGWTKVPLGHESYRNVIYESFDCYPQNYILRFRFESYVIHRYKDESPMMTLLPGSCFIIYYPGGDVAILRRGKVWDCFRTIVYSRMNEDKFKQLTILGLFDNWGYGAIYDLNGQVRLEYNQKDGELKDRVCFRWRWPGRFAQSDIKFQDFSSRSPTIRNLLSKIKSNSLSIISKESNEKKQLNKSESLKKKKMKIKSSEEKENSSNEEIIQEKLRRYLTPTDEAMIYKGFLERSKNIRERKRPIGYVHLPPIYLRINKYITFRMFSQRRCSLHFSADGKNINIPLGVVVNPDIAARLENLTQDNNKATIELISCSRSFEQIKDILNERRKELKKRMFFNSN